MSNIEYFNFENDFVEHNIRCIPMIVRFKMDKAGIKLKLAEWSKLSVEERKELAMKACSNDQEVKEYNNYLTEVIKNRTGNEATILKIDHQPVWNNILSVPEVVNERANEYGEYVSVYHWKQLTSLQRFALLKLTKPGHESKNFIKAMKEFRLINGKNSPS